MGWRRRAGAGELHRGDGGVKLQGSGAGRNCPLGWASRFVRGRVGGRRKVHLGHVTETFFFFFKDLYVFI